MTTGQVSSFRAGYVCVFKPWSVGVFGDEVISLRVWGLMPEYIPNPMIIEVKTIIPHQRANTPDPSIETPPFRAGRGHILFSSLTPATQVCFYYFYDCFGFVSGVFICL